MHSVRKKCRGHDGAQRAPLENRLYLRNFNDVRVLPVEDQASTKDALTHLALDLRKTVILASITDCQTGKLEARLSYPYQVTPFAVRNAGLRIGFRDSSCSMSHASHKRAEAASDLDLAQNASGPRPSFTGVRLVQETEDPLL